MEYNRLLQQADTLMRSVVAKYNGLYTDSSKMSLIEIDLLLEEIRQLYGSFKSISYLYTTMEGAQSNPPQVVTQDARHESPKKSTSFDTEHLETPTVPITQQLEREISANEPSKVDSREEADISQTKVEEIKSTLDHTVEFVIDETPQITEQPIDTKNIEEKRNTLGESYSTPTRSLSDTIKPGQDWDVIGSRVLIQPIANLHTAIGLNDKFSFIAELFSNDSQKYEDAISRINRAVNFDEGMWILHSYKDETWEKNPETANRITDFVKRRFI